MPFSTIETLELYSYTLLMWKTRFSNNAFKFWHFYNIVADLIYLPFCWQKDCPSWSFLGKQLDLCFRNLKFWHVYNTTLYLWPECEYWSMSFIHSSYVNYLSIFTYFMWKIWTLNFCSGFETLYSLPNLLLTPVNVFKYK